MKVELDMSPSETDQVQFVKESALYKEFLAERAVNFEAQVDRERKRPGKTSALKERCWIGS
jgi:hypothetical protein